MNSSFRVDFPALTQRIRNKPWVYLDSAATALKPWPVIEKISHFYTYGTANVHRGAFFLADQATTNFEETRSLTQKFLNAEKTNEIIFTKGATESLNLVAQSLSAVLLKAGDVVLISEMEHHANVVPWQIAAEKYGAKVRAIPISDSGQLLMEEAEKLIRGSEGPVKIVAVTHCSNVLGTVNDVKTLADWTHKAGAVIVVDGAQMVANFPVDVRALNVDFYAFSAHKIFGPYGTGVLYGKEEWLQKMPPYQGGGSMISEVKIEKTLYNELPHKFEAGTPNIEGVIALGAALRYVTEKVTFPQVQKIEESLLNEATAALQGIPGLQIYGTAPCKAPICSFTLAGAHPSDVASILDQENIAVRAGHLCAQPLMRRMKTNGFVRASFSIFNDSSDIEKLVQGVKKAKEMLT